MLRPVQLLDILVDRLQLDDRIFRSRSPLPPSAFRSSRAALEAG
jgi:hypothetical protein